MNSKTYTTLFHYEGPCAELTSRDADGEANVLVRGQPDLALGESFPDYYSPTVACRFYSDQPRFVNLFRIGKRYSIVVAEVTEDGS